MTHRQLGLRVHQLSGDDLDEIAAGGGGSLIQRLEAARRSKVRLALRFLLDRAGSTPGSTVRTSFDVLARAEEVSAAVVEELLDYPSVASWLLRAAQYVASGQPELARTDVLAWVAATATHRTHLDGRIQLPAIGIREPGRLVLPGLGTGIVAQGHDRMALWREQGGSVMGDDRPLAHIPDDRTRRSRHWQPLPRIQVAHAGVVLRLTVDADYLERGAIADSEPMEIEPSELSRWTEVLQRAWSELVGVHGRTAEDVAAIFTVLTPIRARSYQFESAISTQAHGALLMSAPRNALEVALTLAHEVQHAKLALVADFFPMLKPHAPLRMYAPWREDLRPIEGLFHGAYAHLGVANFWRERLEVDRSDPVLRRAETQFARWRAATIQVSERLLDLDVLTHVGRRFTETMLATAISWQQFSGISPGALRDAEDLSRAHAQRAVQHAREQSRP